MASSRLSRRFVRWVGAIVLVAGAARANGRFPNAQQVVVGPGAASDVIALRTTFGLVVSRDGGRRFQWVCEAALFDPFPVSKTPDPAIAVTARGAVLYGFEWGVRSLEACGLEDATGVGEATVVDLATDPAGETVWAVEGVPGERNAVLRAPTDTLRFERLGVPPEPTLWLTLDVAPSRTSRLYLTGSSERTGAPVFYRSDDGGRTLVALSSLPSTADSAFVSAVDPRDPAVLYVRTLEGLSSALYRSADGGATLQPVLRFTGTMDGFALDATGQTVWVGGPSDGLYRSDDGGRTFTQISPRGVFCLHHRAGALYACADWVTGAYALGRSTDGGGRFETVLRFESVDGAVACGPSQRAGCDAQWPTFAQFFQRRDADASVPVPPRDAARPMPRDVVLPSDVGPRDAGVDAAAVPPEVPAARGCGCVAAPPSSPMGAGVCALLVGVSCLRRRRRRPSQAPLRN